jgi:hypothetical protein
VCVWVEGAETRDRDVLCEEAADAACGVGIVVPDVGFGCELEVLGSSRRGGRGGGYHGNDENFRCNDIAVLIHVFDVANYAYIPILSF